MYGRHVSRQSFRHDRVTDYYPEEPKKSRQFAVAAVILAAIIGFCTGTFVGSQAAPNASNDTLDEVVQDDDLQRVLASSLWSAFDGNSIAAAQKYGNLEMLLQGDIQAVKDENPPVVEFNVPGFAQAEMIDQTGLSDLREGDLVSMRCRGAKSGFLRIIATNCVLRGFRHVNR